VNPPSPYKGLAPFEDSEVDASFFFGRDREEGIITANLTAARLTLLYGASGVGKSSVLRAAVVRRLRALPGPLAVVVFDRWREDPGRQLRAAVAASAGEQPAGSLADTLEAASARLGGELYVILDGAEEYFVYHAAENDPGTFGADFAAAVTRPGLRANFLLSLREDALAGLDRFKARIPSLFANSLRLEHLDRDAAREAIVGPIEQYNRMTPNGRIEIEPELVEAVLDEVASGKVDVGLAGRGVADGGRAEEYVETPYLSLVMERLWEVERDEGSDVLRLRTLAALGGAEQIVRDHLDHALDALPSEGQQAAAEMFNHLVTPSGTKIAHRVSDLAEYAGVGEREVEPILHLLTTERILRPVAAADGSSRYEIFHDVLAQAVLAWRARHHSDRELEAERVAAGHRQRRVLVVGVAATAVIAILAASTVYALVQRSDARAEATRARAREFAARAATELSVNPVRSVELAVRAARLERSPQTEDMLRTALRGLHLDALFNMHAPVRTVQFSSDGRVLVVAGGDQARVYRVRDHRLLHTLKHGAPITGAWFDPYRTLILTAGNDGIARAWNPSTGRLVYQLRHYRPINGVTFSRNGRLVATASDDHTARIWRASDGRLLKVLRHPRAVETTSFDRGGSLLATAASDKTARVFDVATGRLVSRLDQAGTVVDVAFAPQGPVVATVGADTVFARIWNARTGKLRLALGEHVGRVLDVEFDPHGDRLVTANAEQTSRVWDARTGDLVTTLFGDTNQVLHTHFSPDGKSVVTASSDRTARVFDATGALRSTLVGHRDTVADAIFSPDGEAVATASTDGTAGLWSWRAQPYLQLVGRHRGSVVEETFSRDGRRLLSAGTDGRIRIWGIRGRPLGSFGGPAAITSASFGADRVVVSSADGVARLWRFPGHLLRTFSGPTRISVAALAPDGLTVATADAKGEVRLWDAGTGHVLHSFGTGGAVTALTFSSDGRELVAAGRDSIARLWRVDDGRLLHELRGHRGAIVAASFSPDNRLIVTAGVDRTARLWNVETGKTEHLLQGHRKLLTAAAFSPDGRLLVTTSLDADARLWDVATGRGLAVLRVHYSRVSDAAFTGDSRWVVTAGGGGAAIFSATSGRILYLLRTRDVLPLKAAVSPDGWSVAIGGSDGYVETHDCRLCGGLGELLSLASKRLAQLHATS